MGWAFENRLYKRRSQVRIVDFLIPILIAISWAMSTLED